MKIAFLTRSLNKGGAERQLVTLAKGLSARKHEVHIICFYSGGIFELDLLGTDVEIHQLHKTGRWDTLGFIWRLYWLMKNIKPEILHGYLAVPNIVALIMQFLRLKIKVVWGVRASDMDLSQYDWTANLVYRVECLLSKFADLIIANSHTGKKYAIRNGFPKKYTVVVSNGIDTEIFKPDLNSRKKMRDFWGVKDDTVVIGTVARLDPMKDYELLLQAGSLLIKQNKNVLFVCVGHGSSGYSAQLKQLCSSLDLDNYVKWFGADFDTKDVYNGFDMLVSTSRTEGFSNVIGEAMSCGLPCVVTDVGDSAFIVGEYGEVLSIRSPDELVKIWHSCLNRKDELSSSLVREQITRRFSVDELVTNTTTQLQALLKGR